MPIKKDRNTNRRPYQRRQHLNVGEMISLINKGKTKTVIEILKKAKCKSPEGCGLAIFNSDLCYNHYHMKVKNGRVARVNMKHNGELCSVCKERPARVRDLCIPCHNRRAYKARKEETTKK